MQRNNLELRLGGYSRRSAFGPATRVTPKYSLVEVQLGKLCADTLRGSQVRKSPVENILAPGCEDPARPGPVGRPGTAPVTGGRIDAAHGAQRHHAPVTATRKASILRMLLSHVTQTCGPRACDVDYARVSVHSTILQRTGAAGHWLDLSQIWS